MDEAARARAAQRLARVPAGLRALRVQVILREVAQARAYQSLHGKPHPRLAADPCRPKDMSPQTTADMAACRALVDLWCLRDEGRQAR